MADGKEDWLREIKGGWTRGREEGKGRERGGSKELRRKGKG